MPFGLLGSGRGHLTGCDEADEHRQDDEPDAQEGVGAGARGAEACEHLLHRRTGDRAAGRLGHYAQQNSPRGRWRHSMR